MLMKMITLMLTMRMVMVRWINLIISPLNTMLRKSSAQGTQAHPPFFAKEIRGIGGLTWKKFTETVAF